MVGYEDVSILVVDDDRVDVMAIRGALEEHRIGNPIYVASDGVNALAMLRGEEGREPIPWPYIILLDLNMPRMNGLEFLKAIRSDERFRHSIVFVLTTSNDDQDKTAAYNFNIAGYVLKSEVGKDFMKLISLLKDFKFVVQFPIEKQ